MINFRRAQGGAQANHTEKSQPAINLPLVVWLLVGLIIAIHAGLELGGQKWQVFANYNFAFIPARLGPEHFPQATGAAVWSFLTYGFLHGSWSHVLFNALWLVVFSKPVEAYFGPLRYLAILAAGIVAGACASLALHWGEVMILVGISGGVSALLAAAIPLMYGRTRPLEPVELITNRPAFIFTLVWLLMTIFTGASQYHSNTMVREDSIAWEAHLAGFAAGLVAFYLLRRRNHRPAAPTLH